MGYVNFLCWVDDFLNGEELSGFLNEGWDFLKAGRASSLGPGLTGR